MGTVVDVRMAACGLLTNHRSSWRHVAGDPALALPNSGVAISLGRPGTHLTLESNRGGGRSSPTSSEVLEVARRLGYARPGAAEVDAELRPRPVPTKPPLRKVAGMPWLDAGRERASQASRRRRRRGLRPPAGGPPGARRPHRDAPGLQRPRLRRADPRRRTDPDRTRTRPIAPSCAASMSSARSRHRTALKPCCRCGRGRSNGGTPTRSGTAPCGSRRRTKPPATVIGSRHCRLSVLDNHGTPTAPSVKRQAGAGWSWPAGAAGSPRERDHNVKGRSRELSATAPLAHEG